jgi:nicotinamide-nucleotide amidase
MKAEIISVGTELLMGQIANTDAQYLSKQLNELGIDIYYHNVVGDNKDRLKELLAKVLERSDIIITTGGIGPTQDDLTKETIAEHLDLEMELDETSLKNIKNFFQSIHKDATINNYKQAYFPKGAIILDNGCGTAPGCILEVKDKIIIVLPGPPNELQHMFKNKVLPYLQGKTGYVIKSCMMKIFGIGESELEQRLIDLINTQTNPTLATYASAGEVTLRITAKETSEESTNNLLTPVIEKVKSMLGNNIYSLEGESMPEVVYKLLKNQNKKVAFAESCTGGMLSSQMVDIPGSSSVLDMSVISYSNEAKINNLGVNEKIINIHGAVSQEVAFEMAKGILNISRADIAVSITGIAGPGGGTDTKPVGLVYVCLYDGKKEYIRKLNFVRGRNYNRKYACLHALDMIRLYLLQCL